MVKHLLFALVLAAVLFTATMPAWAGCTIQSFIINGRFVSCLVCCDSMGNCTTTCN